MLSADAQRLAIQSSLHYCLIVPEESACPFCHLPQERIIRASKYAVAFHDGYPISRGHSLIIPMRHVKSLTQLSSDEYAGLWDLVREFQITLREEFNPDGFNIGVNDGQEAGQTIPHAHVHLIPRYKGDVPDPRGGVRWVLPEKADYWTTP